MAHKSRGIGSTFLILNLMLRFIGNEMSCSNVTESSEATENFNFPELSVLLSPPRHTFNGMRLAVLGDCRLQYDSECKIDNSSGTNVFEGGVAVSLLRDLQLMLNFTDEVFNDGHLSFDDLHGPYMTEAARKFLNGTIDLAISQNVYRPSLAEHVTLLHPTDSFPLKAFFRQPSRNPGSIFVKPFSPAGWGAFCGLWVIIGCVAFFFGIVTRLRNAEVEHGGSLRQAVSDCIIWMVGTICMRGFTPPVSMNYRSLVLAALGTAILTHSAYQAGFVTTLSSHFRPMRTFQDLIREGYHVIVNKNSASIREITKQLFSKHGINFSRMDETDAVEATVVTKTAYVEYFDSFHGALKLYAGERAGIANPDSFFCESISAVRVKGALITGGMVIRKESGFREAFNLQIILLMEFGLRYRYFRIYEDETRPTCLPPQILWRSQIGVKDMSLAFEIVLVGVFISIGILTTEHLMDTA